MKWKVAFAGIIWTVLGGCSLGDERNPRVFRYNESANLTSLDPAHARSLEPMWVTDQIFDGLVELTSELKVAPLIAQSFEVLYDYFDSNEKKDMVLRFYNFTSLFPVSRSEHFSKQILTLDKYNRRTMNSEKQLFRIFIVALNSKVFYPYPVIILRIVY